MLVVCPAHLLQVAVSRGMTQWPNIHTWIPAGGSKAMWDLSPCIPAVGDILQEGSVYAVGADGFWGVCSLFHCKVYLNVNCFREENLAILDLEDQASLMAKGS